jgi:hypothetical protein
VHGMIRCDNLPPAVIRIALRSAVRGDALPLRLRLLFLRPNRRGDEKGG